jgi:hypothetical protein
MSRKKDERGARLTKVYGSLRDIKDALAKVPPREERTDPWSVMAEAAIKRLRFAFLGYFPSHQGKLLSYEQCKDGRIRVVYATPDVRQALGGRLPIEVAPVQLPVHISAAMAEMARLEDELGGPLSFWHEVEDILAMGEVVRLGLPEMEDPRFPHRRAPFGFALQKDPQGVVRVISLFNPRSMPGPPKIGQTIDEIRRIPRPSVGGKLLALATRWGYRLSQEVARRTR